MSWSGRVDRTFICSKRAIIRPTMALYRSVKPPFLPKRGHTVDLKGKRVVLGGSFHVLRGPCIHGRRHGGGDGGDASPPPARKSEGDVPPEIAIFTDFFFKNLLKISYYSRFSK